MKLLQMLKLTKLRKLLRRQAKEPVVTINTVTDPTGMSGKEIFEELCRKDQVGDMLTDIMNEHGLSHGLHRPCPASRQATVSLGQLSSYPPTQLRNIQKTFIREPTSLRYYSDQVLDSLLVEWGEWGDSSEARGATTCRKATPSVLITKRPGYQRKIDGKYNQTAPAGSTVCSGW